MRDLRDCCSRRACKKSPKIQGMLFCSKEVLSTSHPPCESHLKTMSCWLVAQGLDPQACLCRRWAGGFEALARPRAQRIKDPSKSWPKFVGLRLRVVLTRSVGKECPRSIFTNTMTDRVLVCLCLSEGMSEKGFCSIKRRVLETVTFLQDNLSRPHPDNSHPRPLGNYLPQSSGNANTNPHKLV